MKAFFRNMLAFLQMIPVKIVCVKTWFFEWVEIFRKSKLYKDVQWTQEQKKQFDQYWKKNYGKKISPRWHKLYQSINGVFDVTYLPDVIYSTVIEPQLNPYYVARAYQDKAVIEIFANAMNVKAPKTILLNSHGVFYDEYRNVITKQQALECLQHTGSVVLKPTLGGSSGDGVSIIDPSALTAQQREELLNRYGKNYIFQEKIRQHSTFAQLHPDSINTIRLITVTSQTGVTHLPLSMRIGTGSANVDNIHAGGVVIGVTDEGQLKREAYQLGWCDKKDKFTAHPDSGIVFEGYQLDGIPEMIQVAERLHGAFPGIGIISWDFTLSENGESIIIEANLLGQSMWFPQIINKRGISQLLVTAEVKEYTCQGKG